MKMNYQSGDRLKNRYLSNDAFTSLTNKLGGRSIISLGNRRKKTYKVANQGFDLLDYKSIIYKTFVILILLTICAYVIPQTRYFIHGYASKNLGEGSENMQRKVADDTAYNVAPVFLKTDEFISRQKEILIPEGAYAYDFFTNSLIGTTINNSSSTINIKLFSDAGFKNNFLIEQEGAVQEALVEPEVSASTTSSTTPTQTTVVQEANKTYQSFVFEGLGYGQLVAKVPPKTQVAKDTFVYVRTIDGLQPFAKIINVDEDNKSTFTIVYAQLIVSPQNVYKVSFTTKGTSVLINQNKSQ